MTDFSPLLKKMLKQAGCHKIRSGRGDHEIWYSPLSDTNFPVDGDIRSKHTANGVLRQAGLPKAF